MQAYHDDERGDEPYTPTPTPADAAWAAAAFAAFDDENEDTLFLMAARAAIQEAESDSLARLAREFNLRPAPEPFMPEPIWAIRVRSFLEGKGHPTWAQDHVVEHAQRWGSVEGVGPSFLTLEDRLVVESMLPWAPEGEWGREPYSGEWCPGPERDEEGQWLVPKIDPKTIPWD